MARKRRGRGEGGLFQRADGQWTGSVSLGYAEDGKRRRKVVYGATKQEVREKLHKLQIEYALGRMADPGTMTVADYLTLFLNTAKTKTSPTTHQRYEQLVRLHVKPHIGQLRLEKVQPLHIHGLMAALHRAGESLWTQKMSATLLHNAFRQAVRMKLMNLNPCADVPRAKPGEKEMVFLTEDQARRFLGTAAGIRLEALFALALGSGMRQGELLGLRWDDIDLDRGTLTVRRTLVQVKGEFILKEPKSKASRRAIKLPRLAVEALREHRRAMLAEGNISAPVFCTRTGQFIGKSNLIRQVFKPILKRANQTALEEAKKMGTEPLLLPDIRFHDLRHTHASLLLAKGCSIKAVSRRLGHSNVELTLRVYCHVMPSDDDRLADGIEGLIGGAQPAHPAVQG
jgi:integrase